MKKRLVFIVIAFCVSFISLIALSLFSLERFNIYVGYSNMVNQTNLVIRTLLKAESSLKDLDRSERGYILTRDTSYLRNFENAHDSIYSSLAVLDHIRNPNQANNIILLKSCIALRINNGRNDIAYADSSNSSTLSGFYYEGRKYMLEALQKLRDIRKIENDVLDEKYKAEQFYQKLTTSTLKYLLLVFFVVTLILFFLMVKELRTRVRYQEQLKTKVLDLERSHGELSEIAYAASHDLQEPLRKIQVFSDMLLYQQPVQADSTSFAHLQRIKSSANRMQDLITALVNLTDLTNPTQEKKPANINKLLEFLLSDMEEKIEEKNASIHVDQLPEINGYYDQLKVLFYSLIDNSLKFSRAGIKPIVSISGEIMNGYELLDINPSLIEKKFYRITCSDNGIGFDNQFIKKIFRIFQRLHPNQSEFEGKGIGLALCRRIMANHQGYIIASGQPNEGAKFKLFFPVGE
jgi:signal transduction histidine kinase